MVFGVRLADCVSIIFNLVPGGLVWIELSKFC